MTARRAITALAAMSLLAACAANLNGRPVGFGGSTTPGASPTGGGGGSEAAADRGSSPSDGSAASASGGAAAGLPPSSACRAEQWTDAWPYLDRPADPWLAVVDGRPARVAVMPDQSGMPPATNAVCDAAHDHCLRDCTWLVTRSAVSGVHPTASALHVGADGAFSGAMDDADAVHHPEPGFVAYRTVPVTRTNLRVGLLVMALRAPAQDGGRFNDGVTHWALDAEWDVGTVASIDWDVGMLRLDGRREPYFLSATRLAVLRSADGGKVEAIPGVDARAPSVADVIAPRRTATVSDPWAAVGPDGQPIASADATELTGFSEACLVRDLCLRSWVWFVDAPRYPALARWNGTQFVHASGGDGTIAPHVAYRTRAAAATDLTPGLRVLVFESSTPPASEVDAHNGRHWSFVEVGTVDRDRGTFNDRGDQRHPIAHARLLVLYWFPGDKAAKVE